MNVPIESNIDPQLLCAMVNDAQPGPNYVHKTVPVESNLNFSAWEKYGHIITPGDPYLLDQLVWGFPTGVENPEKLSVPCTNHRTARENPAIVEEYILKHTQTKAVYGPFSHNPLSVPITVSPLQVAFSSSGKPRVCNDLSFGPCSVNSLISTKWDDYPGYFGDLELPKIDALVQAVLDRGPTCLLWKTDYSSYYKQLNTDPGHLPQLAFAYDGKVYFENRLPFGLRSSCLNAQRVTNAVIKIYDVTTKSTAFISGYIDDCIGCSYCDAAATDYSNFIDLNHELGLALTDPKCVTPCPCLVWIGLECDVLASKLRIPQDKLHRIIQFLKAWLEKRRASKTDLQAILGVLNHAAAAIIVGRAFTGHIMDLIRESEFPIDLPAEFYQDIQFWLYFLQGECSDGFTLKTPILIPHDHLVQVAFSGDLFAVKILDSTKIYQVVDQDIEIDHACLYIFAFWKATLVAAPRFPGTWITCGVLHESAVKTINRARNVSVKLRPMVRHTWSIQAQHDMVIRAKKVICERPIDIVLRAAEHGIPVSYKSVPDITL